MDDVFLPKSASFLKEYSVLPSLGPFLGSFVLLPLVIFEKLNSIEDRDLGLCDKLALLRFDDLAKVLPLHCSEHLVAGSVMYLKLPAQHHVELVSPVHFPVKRNLYYFADRKQFVHHVEGQRIEDRAFLQSLYDCMDCPSVHSLHCQFSVLARNVKQFSFVFDSLKLIVLQILQASIKVSAAKVKSRRQVAYTI